MPLLVRTLPVLCRFALLGVALHAGPRYTYHVAGEEPGSWPAIFGAIGMSAGADGPSTLVVLPTGVPALAATWRPRIEQGALVVVEGSSELAESFGISPTAEIVSTRNVRASHEPSLPIVWERQLNLPRFRIPSEARVFVYERWTNAPLVVGVPHGKGALLWVIVTPGQQGHERFPYLLHALMDLGLEAPFRTGRLWAFFDSSYRLRADVDYLAERWRRTGIGALHVAAWNYFEADPERDRYLSALIEACHRRAILVYAWLEYPHVSEKFWNDHPEWREKTALLQDAQLDWRKLMNLANPECARAVGDGTRLLLGRFDWDGVNLAELYFESLEGLANPARFTPFNEDVRGEFQRLHDADPAVVARTPGHPLQAALLDYRAALARRLQEHWLEALDAIRRDRPHLDLVLTHVDDRFDRTIRDKIGAESSRLLPLAERYDFTFMIEDPATIWNLGPGRYQRLAEEYRRVTTRPERLAIDINIVERYQDVYPTRQQTGTELLQLLHVAGGAFARVAIYFENSIRRADIPLVSSAASGVESIERAAGKLAVKPRFHSGIAWEGNANVNGRLWPLTDGATLWLPAGPAVIEPSPKEPPLRILDLNAEVRTAAVLPQGAELSYTSPHRAMAVLDRRPDYIEVDGQAVEPEWLQTGARWVMRLPRGQHLVVFLMQSPLTQSKMAPQVSQREMP